MPKQVQRRSDQKEPSSKTKHRSVFLIRQPYLQNQNTLALRQQNTVLTMNKDPGGEKAAIAWVAFFHGRLDASSIRSCEQ